MNDLFVKELHFGTPIWQAEFPQYVDDLNKISDEYIDYQKKRNKDLSKQRDKELKAKLKDKYLVHHSTTLVNDARIQEFINFCALRSNDFMAWSGFDTKNYEALVNEFWVQEFSKLGGGHHNSHVHWNQHV